MTPHDHADGDERGQQRRHVRGDRADLEAVRHGFDDTLNVTAEEELERVLQRHGQADGHDHLLHGADVAAAQRTPYDLVLDEAGQRADDHGEDGGSHERHVQHLRAHEGHQAAERDLFSMGEGLQSGSAIHEVHTHGHQAQHQTEDNAGIQLLPDTFADIGATFFG